MQRLCTLTGGDDYELVFTAPIVRRADVQAAAARAGCGAARIGTVEATPGLRIADASGRALDGAWPSFDHFA